MNKTRTRHPFPTITAQFPGVCPHCERSFEAGQVVAFRRDLHRSARRVRHVRCELIDVLGRKSANAGLLSLTDSMLEGHYLGLQAGYDARREALMAERDALHAEQDATTSEAA